MEPIKIYNDQLNDLISLGKITQNEAYDILESYISTGYEIIFYQSFYYPNDAPLIKFDNIDIFKKWRKEKETYSKYLQDLFRK